MRLKLQSGDYVAFYGARMGVVASARVSTPAVEPIRRDAWPEPRRFEAGMYALRVSDVDWVDPPVAVATNVDRLAAMRGRPEKTRRNWAWLVASIRRISEADFRLLTSTAHPHATD
jgi:hypothetical protein